MDWSVGLIVAGAWVILAIIFFGPVGMAIYSTVLQRRGLRTAEAVAGRGPQLAEASRRGIELAEESRARSEALAAEYKTRHEEVLDALARQTAVLERILAVLERGAEREGIRMP